MRNSIPRWISVTLLLVVPALITGGTLAEAQPAPNALLRGDYVFTLTRICATGNLVNVPGGGNVFEDPLSLVLRGPAGRNIRMDQGILHFGGDGTGSVTGRSIIRFDNVGSIGSSPVRQNAFECDISYQVNPDRSFTLRVVDCSVIRLAGVDAGRTFAVTDDIVLEGQISRSKHVLIFGDTDINVENLTSSFGDNFQRICARNGNAVKR